MPTALIILKNQEEYKKAIFDEYEKAKKDRSKYLNYQNVDKYLNQHLRMIQIMIIIYIVILAVLRF